MTTPSYRGLTFQTTKGTRTEIWVPVLNLAAHLQVDYRWLRDLCRSHQLQSCSKKLVLREGSNEVIFIVIPKARLAAVEALVRAETAAPQ